MATYPTRELRALEPASTRPVELGVSLHHLFWSNRCAKDVLCTTRLREKYMSGYANWMTSSSPPQGPSLQEAITSLRHASMIHSVAWNNYADPHTRNQALRDGGAAATIAIKNLPIIYDFYLGARDGLIRDAAYIGSPLKTFLDTPFGFLVEPVTKVEQEANKTISPNMLGNARLPPRPIAPAPTPLDNVLNKIKHRYKPDSEWLNFRSDLGQHILVICGPGMGKKPDYLLEFDVLSFCDLCEQGLHLL